ncbi:PREDICTED: exocyst complex component 4-like, partial [Buceros rhinoceros silvestris]|uniref:exocyst complex component 4-like n=1 Tax=Buceros rhinoceros silvestris TaxID=175836 RepID=UPI0005281942
MVDGTYALVPIVRVLPLRLLTTYAEALLKDVSNYINPLTDVIKHNRITSNNICFGSGNFAKFVSVRETSLLEIKEDTELDPEENSAVFMGVLIKGLAKLKKIPETVKAIQDRLEQELKQIVKRSTTQVADNGYQRGENLSQENQPRLLLELLELLFDKFNAVAAAHSVVLGHLQQTVASPCSQYDGDIKLYDMVDVWVKIQDVLQ